MTNEAREVVKNTINELKKITRKLEREKFPKHQDIKDNKEICIALNVALISDEQRKK